MTKITVPVWVQPCARLYMVRADEQNLRRSLYISVNRRAVWPPNRRRRLTPTRKVQAVDGRHCFGAWGQRWTPIGVKVQSRYTLGAARRIDISWAIVLPLPILPSKEIDGGGVFRAGWKPTSSSYTMAAPTCEGVRRRIP
jgi:hypothetical protein